jgi:hypothetical protein
MAILIEYPMLAALVGALFLGLGFLSHRRLVGGAGVLWLLYALYEIGMQQRWLCTGECNIRIDLLLIYPVLLLSSVAALLTLLRPRRARAP